MRLGWTVYPGMSEDVPTRVSFAFMRRVLFAVLFLLGLGGCDAFPARITIESARVPQRFQVRTDRWTKRELKQIDFVRDDTGDLIWSVVARGSAVQQAEARFTYGIVPPRFVQLVPVAG